MPFATQFHDGPFGHLGWQRPAVPPLAVLHLGEAAALASVGQNHGGLIYTGYLGESFVDLCEIVAVDRNGPTTESVNPLDIGVHIPAQFGRTSLAETIDIDDCRQVG